MSIITLESPIGPIALEAEDGRLRSCLFARAREHAPCKFLISVSSLLKRYFNGEDCLSSVPLALEGTAFQREVWEELRRVPFGSTVSYGVIARRLSRPNAFRAVAQACGANKLCLFVPCHRVIAANGSLCGFSQGLSRKKFLLDLESLRKVEPFLHRGRRRDLGLRI